MARRKVTEAGTKESTKTVKKTNVNLETITAAMDHAGKSGVALKRSTVDNAGVYPIVNKENGASLATRLAVYALAVKGTIKNPNAKIKPEHLIEVLESPEFVPISGMVNEILGKEWRNFGTLRSRLKKEVKSGNCVGFQTNFDAAEEYKAMTPRIKKLLK